MKCDNIREKFPDFLTGELEAGAKAEFDAHIATCAACGEELRRLSEIWTKLGVLPAEQPSPALSDRFYTMLEAYKNGLEAEQAKVVRKPKSAFFLRRPWLNRPAFQYAAAAVLLVAGLAGGYGLSRSGGRMSRLAQEIESMRGMMAVSLLQQSSSSERLRGVSYTAQLKKPGQSTLEALIQTLDNDPNVNVRLAAADALYLFASYPEVKDGLIRSLAKQESPLVQSALIDLLVVGRERRAVDALKSLIGGETLQPEIKKKAELGIQQLSF